MKKLLFLFLLSIFSLTLFSQADWSNVKAKGADPLGKVKCTKVINDLIGQLAAKGGGTVFFPAGTYLTGPIIMKSNITLWLDAGAVIKFSDDFDDYLPMVQSRWEDVRVKNFASQVYAYQCNNIAIRGRGHFEGQGQKWWDFMRTATNKNSQESKWQAIFKKENAELLAKNEYLRARNNFLRPPMITTYECKDVLIEGVSFSNPPFWTIMPAFTDNITITGITIENPSGSPNTDGIDPSSCRNVHISNCHITVGDDCIVIKSGRDEDGREAARPTENITIDNCTMLRGHGGVVIGSEMSGNVKRVAITNCVFEGTDRGIRVKTMRGRGGVIEDLLISNIVMNNMVNEGVLITLRYQKTNPEPLSERTPACRNVRISGIIQRGGQRAIAIYGLEEMDVQQVSISNLESTTTNGVLIENGSGISFHDIKLDIKEGSAIVAKDSKNISWDHVRVVNAKAGQPLASLSNCKDVQITNCYQTEEMPLLISEDDKTENIIIANNILPGTVTLTNGKGKNTISSNNILKNFQAVR
ncbi:MAG TPA: glycoside hydrolase family 28 protein [Bacteroidales bacterium]|nr:glycoside hydrolase family 28 protein [Bacteroidales bacterium]